MDKNIQDKKHLGNTLKTAHNTIDDSKMYSVTWAYAEYGALSWILILCPACMSGMFF
jgi:hypothetical protein